MSTDDTAVHWLDERHSLTLVELSDLSGLTVTELTGLVECGVLAPGDTAGAASSQQRFASQCLVTARTAARLRADFGLHPDGLALAVQLLDRIRELEAQLQQLQARMPRYRR